MLCEGSIVEVSHLFGDISLQRRHISASGILVGSVGGFWFIARALLFLFIPAILRAELVRKWGIDLLEQRIRLQGNVYIMYNEKRVYNWRNGYTQTDWNLANCCILGYERQQESKFLPLFLYYAFLLLFCFAIKLQSMSTFDYFFCMVTKMISLITNMIFIILRLFKRSNNLIWQLSLLFFTRFSSWCRPRG